jgi:hypothetical protein
MSYQWQEGEATPPFSDLPTSLDYPTYSKGEVL